MDDKQIIQKLENLRSIHAPTPLHGKILRTVGSLPEKHHGFYFPLFAFQMALVGMVVVILFGVGSGIVVAAKGSYPGNPFYGVKEIMQKVAPHVFEEKLVATPTPSQNIHDHSAVSGEGNKGGVQNHDGEKIIPPGDKRVERAHTQQKDTYTHNQGEKHGGVLRQLFNTFRHKR